jgi:indolepyruvate ferredoxin oxidoreductase
MPTAGSRIRSLGSRGDPGKLDHDRHRLAVALASLPEQIRGYGHVKQAHLDKVAKRQEELLTAFRAPAVRQTAAE